MTWIFVEGQANQGTWILTPPQLLGYITESEDSTSIINLQNNNLTRIFMTTQFINFNIIQGFV